MKETKDKIILKALQYFAEHDYQTVSLNSIAKGIGITKGGIYHYFNSKDDLFLECMTSVVDKMKEFSLGSMNENIELEDVLTALFSFDNIFKIMADSFNIDFMDNYYNYSYMIFVGMKKFPQFREMISKLYVEMQQGLEFMFISYAEKGLVRKDINYKLLSFELIALVEGAILVAGFSTEIDLIEVGKDIVKSTIERISV